MPTPFPYPTPSSPAATAVMRGNRKANTKPELALRSALHRHGLRYRIHQPIQTGVLRAVPDVVFPRARVAVFVDGCLWHCCPEHGSSPRANASYWLPKLAANVARDSRVNLALEAAGWTVVRVWEHRVSRDADTVAAELAATIGDRSV
jgi:DNA mismatch endonuclease (patch repair protein)